MTGDFQVPRFKFQGKMFVFRGASGGNLGDATVLQEVLQRDCCEAVLSGRVATDDSLVESKLSRPEPVPRLETR